MQEERPQIYNDDQISVNLVGPDASNTGTFIFNVVYTSKTVVCLLSNTYMTPNYNQPDAGSKTWSWELKLKGKTYKSSDTGQSVGRVPSVGEFLHKCSSSPMITTAGSSFWLRGTMNYGGGVAGSALMKASYIESGEWFDDNTGICCGLYYGSKATKFAYYVYIHVNL